MNKQKDRGKLLCILGLVCLLAALVLWVYFAVHCFEYYATSNLGGMTKILYSLSLTLEQIFIAFVLSFGTLFSWLGFKFTHTEKLKRASKVIFIICMVMFGITALGIVYFLFIQKI